MAPKKRNKSVSAKVLAKEARRVAARVELERLKKLAASQCDCLIKF